jgi:hypothetical protein
MTNANKEEKKVKWNLHIPSYLCSVHLCIPVCARLCSVRAEVQMHVRAWCARVHVCCVWMCVCVCVDLSVLCWCVYLWMGMCVYGQEWSAYVRRCVWVRMCGSAFVCLCECAHTGCVYACVQYLLEVTGLTETDFTSFHCKLSVKLQFWITNGRMFWGLEMAGHTLKSSHISLWCKWKCLTRNRTFVPGL